MDTQSAYDELVRTIRETALLGSCAELLGWDELTGMPPKGSDFRGRQLALLAGLRHERATSPRLGELLTTLEGSALVADADSGPAAVVRELRRRYNRSVKLPRTLVEELARTTSAAHPEWAAARKADNFARFLPWLEKILVLKREQAQALAGGGPLYDALLDEYEPGARSADLAALFADLGPGLTALTQAVTASGKQTPADLLRKAVAPERQRVFSETVAAAVGFDFDAGRLDTSAHPFCCGIGPGDVRLTTRFRADDLGDALFSTLHEAGHGMYEQGLDPEQHGTPLGEAVSLGVHESQSRLWENLVGRSRPFWDHFFPLARSLFREALAGMAFDTFFRAINRVAPSLIRTQADEVTYNLHVLVRFELEQALLNKELSAADLPAAWNEAYRKHLGVTPPSDADGCLQDVHWSGGLFGYFPTYTLGNVFAAQLFEAARTSLGDLDAAFRRGDFAGLLGWLRDKIHRQGQRYPATELIKRATGQAPSSRPLLEGLRKKYGELVGLS
jgi:carboxypeptidase Taq